MKTLIFDKSAGRLQWISDKEVFREALREFYAAVGIDPHKRGLNPADWVFYRMKDEKAQAIAAQHEYSEIAGRAAA
jgi:hypothetical protein